MQKAKKNIAPPCDCCGGLKWEYRLSENGFDLGCCTDCGLLYLSEVPLQKGQAAEVKGGHFASNRKTTRLKAFREAELSRRGKFQFFCSLVQKSAPPGKWMDIGCGAGALIEVAMELGIDIEGVEPMSDRRELAIRLTGAVVHDRQIEFLDIMPASFAAVTLTDVFSHLSSPMATLSNIHRILQPGGILLLYTSEIGAGVAKHHHYSWDLGDHRYYLGEHTIERYADKIGFEVIFREKKWAPELLYSRENLLMTGRSILRNVIKKACVYTPGVLTVLRWYMLKIYNKNNPHYVSTLLLKKKTS
jgi:2-polyprenyl-3-methyl-5-hydroxy-6-metoxy-1,4-benzoquinol methylase